MAPKAMDLLPIFCFTFYLMLTPCHLVSTTKSNTQPESNVLLEDGCEFPEHWRGQWLHLGFPQPLNITKNLITSKGTCLQRSGAKFIIAERYQCIKCMVIHEKHPNVLQYKESFCDNVNRVTQGFDISVDELCQTIESDSALFFMFRHPPQTARCPFEGVHAFSYSTRGGTDNCNSDPPSQIDLCTDPSKMVLKFQACPDVPGSEISDEVLECIATWKEGSSRYLVGQLQAANHLSTLATSVAPAYQCFRYERHIEDGKIVTKMSQSYRGSCEGLWSVEEGDKTYTLWQVHTELKECGLPHWLMQRPVWKSLDGSIVFEMRSGGSRRFTMKTRRKHITPKENFNSEAKSFFEHSSHMTCQQLMDQNSTFVKAVVYQKEECTSGYRCLELTSVHRNIIHLRIGNRSRHADEACSQHFFSVSNQPVKYLIPESGSEDCPFLGRFEQVESIESPVDVKKMSSQGNVWSFKKKGQPSHGTRVPHCQSWLQIGCPLNNNMVMHQCTASLGPSTNEELLKMDEVKDATCVGYWPRLLSPQPRGGNISSKIVSPNNLTDSEKSLPLVVIPVSSTFLVVQDRNGLAKCIEYSRIPNSSRHTISLKIFESECLEQFLQSHVNLTYQGACQEALTDSASVSGESDLKNFYLLTHLPVLMSFILLLKLL